MRRFEVFRAPHRFDIGARVTLTYRGFFAFNRAALELLGKPEAVIYLYDRESETVAFAPASRSVAYAYPISVSGRSGAGASSAVKFCKHYGIPCEVSLRCPAELAEGRLVVELRKGMRTGKLAHGQVGAHPST